MKWKYQTADKIESRNWWDGGLSRGSRMQRARIGKAQREKYKLITLGMLNRAQPKGPLKVTLTRASRGRLDDDNLAGGFKHVRDGIADALNRDDGPNSGVKWIYLHEKGPYGARVQIEEVE